MTSLSVSTQLADQLDGRILVEGDDGFDDARTVWNAMVDRRPRAIVQCHSVADVQAAVRTARELGLEIGVRCGGHGVLGLAVPEDGLMLDLTPMGAVVVDPVRRRAVVQGGALLGALDREAQVHGLATTAGNVSHTGVGGLTLGGGMGWLARQFGLACDNVESYEVVTADGAVVRASADEHSDLFWALRGGGGNFGVVTEFVFRLHDIGTAALLVEYRYGLDRAAQVLRTWRDLNADAPRQATFIATIGPDNLLNVGYVWVGDPEEGRALLASLEAMGTPDTAVVRDLPYVELQTMDDTVDGHALRRYFKGHYLAAFSDEAIEAFVRRGSTGAAGELLPNVGLQAYGGAIADIADDDAAFAHRGTMFEYVAATGWTDADEDQERMAGARRAAADLDDFASGVYVNVLSDDGDEGVRRAYPPEKLAKLTAVKDTYDPDNVFRLNQNIPPSSG